MIREPGASPIPSPTPERAHDGLPPASWYPPSQVAAPAAPPQGSAPPPPPPPPPPYGAMPGTAGPTTVPGEWHGAPPYAGVDVCQNCGAVPAGRFTFGRVIGMVVLYRRERVDIVACRSCALAAGRSFQSRTMALGWWGIISFFFNLYWIARNALGLRRASHLPVGVNPSGPMLDPGKPVLLRAGAAVSALFVGGLGWLVWDAQTAPGWKVGSCVDYADNVLEVKPVRCGDDHLGKIVATVTNEADCPITAEGVVEVPGYSKLFCIDEQA